MISLSGMAVGIMLTAMNTIITIAAPLPSVTPIASGASVKSSSTSVQEDGVQIDIGNINAPYSQGYLSGMIDDIRNNADSALPSNPLNTQLDTALSEKEKEPEKSLPNMNAPYSQEYLDNMIDDIRNDAISAHPSNPLDIQLNNALHEKENSEEESFPFAFTIAEMPPGLKKLSTLDPMKYAHSFQSMEKTVDKEIKPMIRSYYSLMSVLGVAGLVFSVAFAGIKLMSQGLFFNRSSKEDIMSALGAKVVAFSILCGLVFFIGLVGELVSSIVP